MELLYEETFDDATHYVGSVISGLPKGWVALGGTSFSTVTAVSYGRVADTGDKVIVSGYPQMSNRQDVAFSPMLELKAGTDYRIRVKYMMPGLTPRTSEMKITVGMGQDYDSHLSYMYSDRDKAISEWTQAEFIYTPSQDGQYCVGLWNSSTLSSAGDVFYDTFSIEEIVAEPEQAWEATLPYNETFDRVTEGTESSPVYGAIQGALNDYTEYADWYAITPVMANGKIGLKNYYMIMGYYSMLYTPIYFVESNTASTVTISMDVKRVDCSAATEVGVCLVNAATEEAGEWQFQTLTDAEMTLSFEFEPTESYYLAIGFDDPSNADYGSTGIVFFDRVTVEQANLSAGDQVIRVYAYDMPYNETYYVETSNKRDTEQFSYYVMAVTNGESEYLYSDPSNEIVVGTTGSVDAVTTDSSRMYGADGELCVETDAAGICVARQAVAEGTTGIALPAGFYVVRLGGSVAKVLVK